MSPADAAGLLHEITGLDEHEFWPDTLSLDAALRKVGRLMAGDQQHGCLSDRSSTLTRWNPRDLQSRGGGPVTRDGTGGSDFEKALKLNHGFGVIFTTIAVKL